MQYLQSPPELLNLGTYTEGDRRKKEIFMRSGRLNPFGKVWSTTHIIVKVHTLFFLCSSSFLRIVWCYFEKCILQHI